MIQQAAEKLTAEADAFNGNKGLLSPIYSYLLSVLNEELAGLVIQEKYTLSEMVQFVTEMARKELDGKSGALADDVVYGFATDYYHSTREDIEKILKVAEPVPKPAAKTEAKTEHKPVAKPAPKEKKPEQAQVSLFDLMGGLADA